MAPACTAPPASLRRRRAIRSYSSLRCGVYSRYSISGVHESSISTAIPGAGRKCSSVVGHSYGNFSQFLNYTLP